jgi:hypothetical protein
MKKLLLALSILLLPSAAFGQCNGVFGANQVCGSIAGGVPGPVNAVNFPIGLRVGTTTVIGGSSTGVLYNNSGVLGADVGLTWVPGGPLTISPTANSANQGLVINQPGLLGNVAGTTYAWAVQASPALLYNSIAVTTDTANVTGAPTQFTIALNVGLVTGGANSQGTKTAFSAQINHAYSGSNPTLGRDHIAASFYAIGSVGDGGTGTTLGTAKGTLFATNPIANASSGATNLFSVSGGEVDVGIATGASARHRLGWSVIGGGNLRGDTGSGGLDAAYEVGAGSTSWATGLIFSSLHGAAPIATTGTLIGTDGVNITAASGVDFSAYTLTTFLRGPSSNFIASGAGAITGTSLQINNGTITWNDGTAVGIANIGALFTRSVQLGSNNNFNVVFVTNNTLAGYFDAAAVGTFNLGSGGISQGVLNLNGLTSGTVAIKVQAAAGTYNFNLPISAGSAGQVLTSQGGGATAQSYQDINALLAATSPITKSGTTTVTFACATCVTSAASLTANQLVIGSGSQGEQSLGTLGTSTTVLHGNAGGAPTYSAVSLTADVSGVLPGVSGGTGLSTAAIGDLIYASATTPTWSRLADVATGSVLVSGGVNTAPAWSTSPTITISVTTPLHIGGTGTTGTQLTLQTTTGVGTTDAVSVKGGNNGGTTFGTWNTNGLGIGGTIVNQLAIGSSHALTVQSTSARSTMELINSSTGTGGVAGSFAYYNGTERLISMDASADGATNSGIWTVYVDNAGALTGQMSLNHVGFLSVNGSLGVGVGSDPGVGAVFAGAFVQATTYLQSGTKLRATGTAPALTSCGTSPTIEGSDLSGTVTMGTGSPTGCVITFNVAYTGAPRCTVSWRVNIASMQYAVSTTAITLTQTATSSNVIDYVCTVRNGGWLLKRDLAPAANDNTPAFMDQAA